MKIPAEAFVVVADGRKALILKNHGDATYPNLRVEATLEGGHNPSTHEQGADRPGRAPDGPGHHRSAVDQTDWHTRAEEAFAGEVAAFLLPRCRAGEIGKLIVVAAPHTLASLRAGLAPVVTERVIGEIDKDLTKHPVFEIERLLAAH